MQDKTLSLLMLEDSPLDAELTLAHLVDADIPHIAKRVDSRAGFIQALEETCPDLILADYSLPAFDGLTALSIAQKLCPDVPFIFVSGMMGEEVAIETLQRGATDYVLKQRLKRIGPAIRRALEEVRRELEQKHTAEELARKARELTVLNGDLEQFAYIASHDLQEPLRTISIFSRLISREYRGRIDDRADEYLGYIESAAQHMSALLQDLLTYTKIPAQDRAAEAVDLKDVLSQTLFLFQVGIARTNAVIASDELPIVPGNASQLGVVFQNLISNALKYKSEEPPRIEIRAENIGTEWKLSIKDNGIGFDPAYAEQIFGLFKRLEKTRSSGTGLGLAICKRIIEAHGGSIWAESSIGTGSTFFFTLPVNSPGPSERFKEHERALADGAGSRAAVR